MNSKCQCQVCSGDYEFDAHEFQLEKDTPIRRYGQMIECPHCKQQTRVYLNKSQDAMKQEMDRFSSWKTKIKWGYVYILGALVLVCLFCFLFADKIGGWVESIFPIVGSATMGFIAFVSAIITFILSIYWSLFPILVCRRLDRMIVLMEKTERK